MRREGEVFAGWGTERGERERIEGEGGLEEGEGGGEEEELVRRGGRDMRKHERDGEEVIREEGHRGGVCCKHNHRDLFRLKPYTQSTDRALLSFSPGTSLTRRSGPETPERPLPRKTFFHFLPPFFLGFFSSSSSPPSRSRFAAFFSISSQSSPSSSSLTSSSDASADASSSKSDSSSLDSSEPISSSETPNSDSSSSSLPSSESDSVLRKLQPPSLKKACGSAMTVFMIVAQFRFSGPSVKGMSTLSSQSLTPSSASTGMVLMCAGGRSELHTFQVHHFDVGQGDDHEGRLGELHQTVGRWLDSDGAAGGHTVEAEIAERHFLNSLSSCARLLFSSCSASNSSSSPYRCFLLRLPVSSNCISVASRCT
ncbi:hypothetical protein KC366_g82 [Hortaea werneckii]|nr:hypothetical protein KC366_g82 [Hortaea werneckii]